MRGVSNKHCLLTFFIILIFTYLFNHVCFIFYPYSHKKHNIRFSPRHHSYYARLVLLKLPNGLVLSKVETISPFCETCSKISSFQLLYPGSYDHKNLITNTFWLWYPLWMILTKWAEKTFCTDFWMQIHTHSSTKSPLSMLSLHWRPCLGLSLWATHEKLAFPNQSEHKGSIIFTWSESPLVPL